MIHQPRFNNVDRTILAALSTVFDRCSQATAHTAASTNEHLATTPLWSSNRAGRSERHSSCGGLIHEYRQAA